MGAYFDPAYFDAGDPDAGEPFVWPPGTTATLSPVPTATATEAP